MEKHRNTIYSLNLVLLTFLFSIIMLTTYAQDQTGTYEFDFTYPAFGTEESINLYSYLDDGKVVIIDFFEYECGPCWLYHQHHILNDFYAEHGPDGDNTAMVMQICTFADANLAKLTGDNGGNWNWLADIDYPTLIIPDEDFYTAFGFLNAGTPTILRICPDKVYYKQHCLIPDGSAPSAPYTLNGLNDWKETTCEVVLDVKENKPSFFINSYPNPASNQITIDLDKMAYLISFTNISGKFIMNYVPTSLHSIIDISNLEPGAYQVEVFFDNHSATNKFIKNMR